MDDLLAAFESQTAMSSAYRASTQVRTGCGDQSHIVLHQDNLGTRHDMGEEDLVVLDTEAQRVLYEILKQRFAD
jgi:hypothetical protein